MEEKKQTPSPESFEAKFTDLQVLFCFMCLFKTKRSNYVRTRQISDLYPSFCRLSTTQQSLKYEGPLEWNQLPLEVRNNCETLKSFNLKIHHYLTAAAKSLL